MISRQLILKQNITAKIPGDTRLFTPQGDGDGKVYSDSHMMGSVQGSQMSETFDFWLHLNQAGMLQGTFKGYDGFAGFAGDFTGYAPKLNYGTGCFLNAYTDLSVTNFGNYWSITAGITGSTDSCMTAVDALALDNKIDDGKPGTGNIVEMYPYSGPYIAPGNHLGCDNNNATQYNIQGNWGVPVTKPYCLLAIKAQW